MLFAVKMMVELPADMGSEEKAELLAREKAYSQQRQRAGEWPQIWRCAGQYSNLSIWTSRAMTACTSCCGVSRCSRT